MLPGLMAPGAFAQYWAPLGLGIVPQQNQVNVVYGDSVWDVILAGGNFKWIYNGVDSILVKSAASWDGIAWDSLPSPIDACGSGTACSHVWEFFRYNGDLYGNGAFQFLTSDSTYNWRFARWNEDSLDWEELECINPLFGGMATMVPVPPQDTLYITGYLGSICGYPQSCVFEYDGSVFYPYEPFEDIPYYVNNYVGYVFKFQDQHYLTGLITVDTVNVEFYGLMRYTGTEWEPVPGFEVYAPIKDILIYNNRLYLCGYFFESTGAPGNLVVAYDGTSWDDLGGGLLYDLPTSTYGNAFDLLEWNGDIYVAGQFHYAGGVPAENVARWNGQQWCGLGGTYANQLPGGTAWSLTTWRDSLYMAGGFVTIDGDSLNNVARWLGLVENCSDPIGIEEPATSNLQLYYDPATATLHLSTAQPLNPSTLELFDPIGRRVLAQEVKHGETVSIAGLPSGVYTARLIGPDGAMAADRFMKY